MNRRQLLTLPFAAALHSASAQFGPRPSPTFDKIAERLRQWAKQHPRIMQLKEAGKSIQGRTLFVARITDRDADDALKEHFLLTSLHSGQEHSGALGSLRIMEWLLSGDALARRILKQQVLMCLPVVNPDSYESPDRLAGLSNIVGEDPYTGWTVDGPRNPAKCPEAVVVQSVIDEFQAEVHGDIHGNSLPFPGVYQIESSGRAYSNVTLRPYHHEIVRLMDQAALAEGFPSDEQEEDAERLFGGTDLGISREKLWAGITTPAGGTVTVSKPRVYAAVYGYNKYHTMPVATECGWERSGLARYRRLLQVGDEVWPGEYYAGYPVRVVMKSGYDMICAYGTTAAARRRSRVELWNRQSTIAYGMNRPWAQGRFLFVCATSAAARAKWLSDTTLEGFARRMREHPHMHADRIAAIVEGFPKYEGQWGRQGNLMLDGGTADHDGDPISHGLSCRLRIPFAKAGKMEIWMNGQPLRQSESDGYTLWRSRGFANLQLNISPERSRREDFYVLTCQFDPGGTRTIAAGW